MHGKLSPAPKRPDKVPGRTCDQWHPVAIEIETGIVRFMFGGPEGATWDGDGKPDAWGVTALCASLALAECYRVVSWTADGAFNYDVKIDKAKFEIFRKAAMMRNVGIFLQWDRWNRERLGMAARLAEVCRWGYECTPTALRRVAENSGLTPET